MNEIDHLEIRRKIFSILSKNPGLNLSMIADEMKISVQLADYHLHYLENKKIISVVKEGGYKRYYLKGEVTTEDKKLLSILQQEIPFKIISFLILNHHGKPSDIKNSVTVSSALLTYYLKKLLRYDIISIGIFENKKQFYLVDDNKILQLLLRYKPNLLLKRFKDSWTFDIPLSSKVSNEKK